MKYISLNIFPPLVKPYDKIFLTSSNDRPMNNKM